MSWPFQTSNFRSHLDIFVPKISNFRNNLEGLATSILGENWTSLIFGENWTYSIFGKNERQRNITVKKLDGLSQRKETGRESATSGAEYMQYVPRKPSCKKKWGTDESGSFARNFSKSGSFSIFTFYNLLYLFRLLTQKCTLCMHNFDVSLQHMKNDNGDRTRPSKHQTLFMEATLVLRLTPNHCPSKLKTLSMQLTDTKQCKIM